MLPPLFLGTWSRYGPLVDIAHAGGPSLSSSGWATNYITYQPIVIPWPYPVKRFFIYNGTAANGNVDMGLYSRDGSKVVSTGSFAQAGTSALQYANASYLIPPGSYYLALGLSASSATAFMAFITNGNRQMGIQEQAGTFPLPNVMTPAAVSTIVFPVFGMTLTESGF